MSERGRRGSPKSGRIRIDKEEENLGSPAQTGPGSGIGMGTEEGSGWPPKGWRHGEEDADNPQEDEEETPPEHSDEENSAT